MAWAGYFRNAEATASALDSEGWLRTGDLCYIDDEGFLFVVDRLKEVIKYNGYQVISIIFNFIYPLPTIYFTPSQRSKKKKKP